MGPQQRVFSHFQARMAWLKNGNFTVTPNDQGCFVAPENI